MCFSATASFTAAALLLPAGVLGTQRAYRIDRRYVAICALPLLFGIQQLLEGIVWIAGANQTYDQVKTFSLGYMFFTWVAWPIWIPVSLYFLESHHRRSVYLVFAVLGGMLGALLYVPYFAHEGWIVTRFLQYAIQYDGIELLDFIMPREMTNLLYVLIVVSPALLASDRDIRVFGVLVIVALAVTYFFFSFAYISVFCFGAAAISLYLTYMIFKKEMPQSEGQLSAR